MLNDEVLPALAAAGVHLVRRTEFTPAERRWAAQYFLDEVRPLLTPIGLDPAHPFPQVVNKSLNFVIELTGRDAFGRDTGIAIIKAPRVLPRIIKLPPDVSGADDAFVMLSSVIHAHLHELFPGREVVNYAQFRVTRDADLWIDEEEVKNLRQALQGELPQRQFGSAVRLEVAADCPAPVASFLLQQFELAEADLYRCNGPVNIARLSSLIDQVDIDALQFPTSCRVYRTGCAINRTSLPQSVSTTSCSIIRTSRSSLSSTSSVAPRTTRTSSPSSRRSTAPGVNSVLMEALIAAALRGKEVTVVVELMARFDEEANLDWAERLERAGAQVVYGVFGLKTHAKLALLVRRERDRTGRLRMATYAHLGTGNYHPRTTRLYTDFGLLTADPSLCADVNEVFMHITSLAKAGRMRHLLLAPFTMHRRIVDMIRRETRNARAGTPSRIIAKMNGLLEEGLIRALYQASEAGVQVDLIVRGACALRPGVKGLSENIRVRSILGRFLEHHQCLVFCQRRGARCLAVLGRLDGPQPVPQDRSRVSRARPGPAETRRRRRPESLSRRQRKRMAARRGRGVDPGEAAPPGAGARRAGGIAAVDAREGGSGMSEARRTSNRRGAPRPERHRSWAGPCRRRSATRVCAHSFNGRNATWI